MTMFLPRDCNNELSWEKHLSVALTLVALGLAVFYVAYFWVFTADDAYISFRYSAALANNGTLELPTVEGGHVEGYVNFLWVALHTIPEAFRLSPVVFSKLLGLVLTLLISYWVGKTALDKFYGLAFLAAVFGNPYVWIHAVSGLETTLYAVLAVVVLRVFSEHWLWDSSGAIYRKALVLSVLGLLLCLTRPEGAAVFAFPLLVAGWYRPRHRRLTATAAGMSIIAGLAYMFWRVGYWGNLFPQPFYVKRATGFGTAVYFDGLRHFGSVLAFAGVLLILFLIASLRGGRCAFFCRRSPYVVFAVAMLPGALLIYGFFAPIMNYASRYLFPLFFVTVVATTIALFNEGRRDTSRHRRNLRLSLLLAGAAMLQGAIWFAVDGDWLRKDGMCLERTHVALGKSLARVNETSSRALCLLDAGAVPYYSRWPLLDLGGLTSPAGVDHNRVGLEWLKKCDLLVLQSSDGKTPDYADPNWAFMSFYPRREDIDAILDETVEIGVLDCGMAVHERRTYFLARLRKDLSNTSTGDEIRRAVMAAQSPPWRTDSYSND